MRMYEERLKQQDRHRNMFLLLKLRPGFFTPDEQRRAEDIAYEIKKTAIPAALGFIATSVYRVW